MGTGPTFDNPLARAAENHLVRLYQRWGERGGLGEDIRRGDAEIVIGIGGQVANCQRGRDRIANAG